MGLVLVGVLFVIAAPIGILRLFFAPPRPIGGQGGLTRRPVGGGDSLVLVLNRRLIERLAAR